MLRFRFGFSVSVFLFYNFDNFLEKQFLRKRSHDVYCLNNSKKFALLVKRCYNTKLVLCKLVQFPQHLLKNSVMNIFFSMNFLRVSYFVQGPVEIIIF